MGNYSAWATVGGQPGRSTQIVRKDVDMKRQLTSRLETRTKESNMHVSIMVENHLCMRNESKGAHWEY